MAIFLMGIILLLSTNIAAAQESIIKSPIENKQRPLKRFDLSFCNLFSPCFNQAIYDYYRLKEIKETRHSSLLFAIDMVKVDKNKIEFSLFSEQNAFLKKYQFLKSYPNFFYLPNFNYPIFINISPEMKKDFEKFCGIQLKSNSKERLNKILTDMDHESWSATGHYNVTNYYFHIRYDKQSNTMERGIHGGNIIFWD